MKRLSILLGSLLIASLVAPAAASAAPPLRAGKRFSPQPRSRPLYGTKLPSADPDVQRHIVEARDGVDLYVETWLPAPRAGRTPPKRIPTVLIMTPYVAQGDERYPANETLPSVIEYLTQRGYAVAQHHVRGTGESGGCLEQTAQKQISDGARVVEYLGRDAPWSNGKVGMFGHSYDAETQISTAGFGNRDKIKYLKAIIPSASVGAQYDWNFMDGVNWAGQPAQGNTSYLIESLMPGETIAPLHFAQRLECQDDVMLSSGDTNGDYTEYWQKREYRPGAPRIDAATLYVHGLRDFNVQPITLAGWFDKLPKDTPHKGIFGVWNHAFPGRHPNVEPMWARADWLGLVTAWYDRYLKGMKTGVRRWPAVQVQTSTGQWWAARRFPTMRRAPRGQLVLGPKGSLGRRKPTGSTSFVEQLQVGESSDQEKAVFQTRPLTKRLQITGQPVLDTWLKLSDSDAHVAVELEVIGRGGEPLHHAGTSDEAVATYGVRSMRHKKPMRRGYFRQAEAVPAPVEKPFRATVRFLPTDLLVPKGGRLRLTVSGSVDYSKGSSQPSGSGSTVTLLHNCKRPSALRFLIPPRKAKLLNVRELGERKLRSRPARIGRRTGGGIARARVCGKRPKSHWFLGGRFPKPVDGR